MQISIKVNVFNGASSHRVGMTDQWCRLLMKSVYYLLSQFRKQVLDKGVNKTQQQHLRKGNSVKCFVQGMLKSLKREMNAPFKDVGDRISCI